MGKKGRWLVERGGEVAGGKRVGGGWWEGKEDGRWLVGREGGWKVAGGKGRRMEGDWWKEGWQVPGGEEDGRWLVERGWDVGGVKRMGGGWWGEEDGRWLVGRGGNMAGGRRMGVAGGKRRRMGGGWCKEGREMAGGKDNGR